ncbi:hypothetical protein CBR_g17708 [Chara braunii]|uniref:Uncharacterized protein n=1 Tax=Chara braunii TaxID=69332 RepID=A0A388KVH2_CHABU|nr:hypothetical protein CBR_g17708 [Chara braunii]|eukprot:GBG73998.1 hypothetical protein CBR_g17708 [Chara braunii]
MSARTLLLTRNEVRRTILDGERSTPSPTWRDAGIDISTPNCTIPSVEQVLPAAISSSAVRLSANSAGVHGGTSSTSVEWTRRSTSNPGQYNQGYGRSNGGNYQPRAFFTKEQADFIDKLKLKEAVEEARKKDQDEIARLKAVQEESEKKKAKGKGETKEQGKKHGAREKGKTKVSVKGKQDSMKKWVAENFGNSLRILTAKLEDVEKKSKLKEAEVKELRMLRMEKELRELRESSSSEKQKRERTSPARVGNNKTKSRTSVLKRRSRGKKPGEIFSDDSGKEGDAVVQNLGAKIDDSADNLKEVAQLKDLLLEILAAKGRESSGGSKETKPTEDKESRKEKAHIGDEQEEHTEGDEEGETNGKIGDCTFGLYFKDRVIYYDAMHYTKVQELCKKRGVTYKRKEAGVWELARLDFEVLMKMEKSEEKEDAEAKESEAETHVSDNSSSSNPDEKSEEEDDIAGN